MVDTASAAAQSDSPTNLGRLGLLPPAVLCEHVLSRLCAHELARVSLASSAFGRRPGTQRKGKTDELPLVEVAATHALLRDEQRCLDWYRKHLPGVEWLSVVADMPLLQHLSVVAEVGQVVAKYGDDTPLVWTEAKAGSLVASSDREITEGKCIEIGQFGEEYGASLRGQWEFSYDQGRWGQMNSWEGNADFGEYGLRLKALAKSHPRVRLPATLGGGYGSPVAAATAATMFGDLGYAMCGANPMSAGVYAADFHLVSGANVSVGVAAPNALRVSTEMESQDLVPAIWHVSRHINTESPQQGSVLGLFLDLNIGTLTFFINGKRLPDTHQNIDWTVPQGQMQGPLCWLTRAWGCGDENGERGSQFGIVRAEGKSEQATQRIAARLATGATEGYGFGDTAVDDETEWAAAVASIEACKPEYGQPGS